MYNIMKQVIYGNSQLVVWKKLKQTCGPTVQAC